MSARAHTINTLDRAHAPPRGPVLITSNAQTALVAADVLNR
jgi:hypothetical protein